MPCRPCAPPRGASSTWRRSSGSAGAARACRSLSPQKGGVVNFTRDLAIELAPDIRVNCVCPGAVDTEMLQTVGKKLGGGNVKAGYDILTQNRPFKRVADPVEIAHAILFLASDLASFVIGSSQFVDGGATLKL